MIVSEYVTIDGESYVTVKNYDKVLYKLLHANGKIEELEKSVNELSRQNGKASADYTELHAEINRLKGQIEAYQHMMKMWSE